MIFSSPNILIKESEGKCALNQSRRIFKGTNLIFRTDGKTPDCYSDLISELDIEDVDLTFLPKHRLQ